MYTHAHTRIYIYEPGAARRASTDSTALLTAGILTLLYTYVCIYSYMYAYNYI